MEDDLRVAIAALLPRLRRFGMALTGSMADADDLVQDACELALARAPQLRDRARLDAWMFTIMRNLSTSNRRVRRRRPQVEIEGAAEIAGEDGQAVTESRLTLAAVRRSLAALPAEHRTVLTLVCVDGLSYKEVAAILDVPIGTVMSRLARARVALNEKLAERIGHPTGIVPLSPARNLDGRAGPLEEVTP